MQLNHSQYKPPEHRKEIIILCDAVSSPSNIGSIFRVADAFGVSEIIFSGNSLDLTSTRLRRTARSTEKVIRFRESENAPDEIAQLHLNGFTSIALEITSVSEPISRIGTNQLDKIVLIIGNERNGVRKKLLEHCHHSVHITMYGTNSSMNVATATGIALYEITRE